MTAPGVTGAPSDDAPAAAATDNSDVSLGVVDASWLRLSPRSLVVRPLTDLVRLLPLLAGLLILHSHTGSGLLWGIAASVAAVVTGVVHWITTRYKITEERIYVRRGLINQKVLSVARDRIRTVDITAHLLHRVLGVCRISIGTGRNDYRSGESFHLDGLTRSDAEDLRSLLLTASQVVRVDEAAVDSPAGSRSTPTASQSPASQPPATAQPSATHSATAQPSATHSPTAQPSAARSPTAQPSATHSPTAQPSAAQPSEPDRLGGAGTDLARLRLNWLRFAPLTTTGLFIVGVLFGSLIQLNNDANIDLAASGPVRLIVGDFAALNVLQRVLVGAAVGSAAYVLIALIGYIAVYWNFRLTGYGTDTIRVTRGLLSIRATTISLSRLRGVEISEPLLLRAAHGARCIAITTGLHAGRGAEHEGAVLLPPAPRSVVRQVSTEVLGIPAELVSGPLELHGPAARRRRYLRALVGAALLLAGIIAATLTRHGPAWVWIGSFVLLPAAALVAADRYRNLGHRLADGWLVTRTGTFARRRSIIGTDAIIGWRIHQTWFQRRQGLLTLTATTAAGQQHYSLRDVPVEQGLAVAAAATSELIKPFQLDSDAL